MKKVFLSLVMALMTALTVSAQIQPEYKVNVGIGSANWWNSDNMNGLTSSRSAYKVGVGVGLPFSNTWSLQTGLNLLYLNTGLTQAKAAALGSQTVDCDMYYIQLPVLAGATVRLSQKTDLLFRFGPYFAYGVGGKTKLSRDGEINTFGDIEKGNFGLERFDCGLTLGIDLEINKFVIGLESSAAFTNVKKHIDTDIHNGYSYLTLGYKF